MDKIVDHLIRTLQKNGFPDKQVTLPFQPVFRACRQHQTSLSAVLKALKSKGIQHQIRDDRILFSAQEDAAAKPTTPEPTVSPELYEAAMKRIQQMDPAEVEALKAKVLGLSPDEQKTLLEKAQSMFARKPESPPRPD
jgi:hypothetical protein